MPTDTHYAVQELLLRYGVTPKHARSLAVSELRNWELSDISAILDNAPRPSPEYCLFKSQSVQPTNLPTDPKDITPLHTWWPSLWNRKPIPIAPPRALVEQSAREGIALCCNAEGDWTLRETDYVALSHVWIEGLQRDESIGGLEKTKITKVFELMRRAGLKSDWIWTDVLVIPGGWPTAPLEDEMLTVEHINIMPSIYDRAEAVLIIDALVVQLQSTDPVEVAVALACGKWATRVWTYQEIKLANRAIVVTATGGVDFHSMVTHLKELSTVNEPKYRKLWLWAGIMTKTQEYRLTIRDLVTACANRNSGLDMDYARAFFPVLGLTWTVGMTREQGMQIIYRSLKRDTTVIASFAGSPRMKLEPGWAPSYLTHLEGIGQETEWEERGIRGEWHILRIKKLVDATIPRYGKIGLNLEVESEMTPNLQAICGPNEDTDVLEAVKKMIGEGKGYILSSTSFATYSKEWARSILIVEKAETAPYHGLEVAVHCAAVIGTPGAHKEEKISLLIRHCNPNVDMDLHNQLRYHWFHEEEISRPSHIPEEEGETPLHAAVRTGDLPKVKDLVTKDPKLIETCNSRGLSPLHAAAARGSSEILGYLCSLPNINLELPTNDFSKDTPLTLSATRDQEKSIEILLDAGAEIERKNGNNYTALMAASYECHAECISLLLSRGADLNPKKEESALDASPLLVACGRNDLGLEVLKLLIEAGAEVNPTIPHPIGWTPLLKASDKGNDGEVQILLSHGAEPNVKDSYGRSPLRYTIFNKREESTRLLLEAGARVNEIFDKEERAVHLAAKCGNWRIMQMLLEKEVEVDVVDGEGKTGLHWAVERGEGTMVKLLLAKRADVNVRDGNGRTALDLAVEKGDQGLQKVLRNNGGKRNEEFGKKKNKH